MITTVTYDRCYEYRGLSTDTKPMEIAKGISVGNGSLFLEMDTCKVFVFDEANQQWIELDDEK